MKKILLTFVISLCTFSVLSNDLFETANQAYNDKDYEKAVVLYDSILQSHKSFEVYYNLGNTYFKLQKLPEAILMYESAKKINPSDADLNSNLEYVRELLKIEQKPSVKELGDLINNFSTLFIFPLWQYLAILLLVSTCIIIFFFFRSNKNSTSRAVLFYTAILSCILMACAYFLSYRQEKTLFCVTHGIVMPTTIEVFGEPSNNSNEVFEITSGYKVQIMDEVDGWYEIAINNGNIGWTQKENIKLISLKN